MYYTDYGGGCPRENPQIFSIEVESIRGGLRWPLDVFGVVTARDTLRMEHKCNIVFARSRSNCQTITEQSVHQELTRPTRAVMADFDPGSFEVVLKVKGATESADKDLSFLVLPLEERYQYCRYYTSKHSTLELTLRRVDRSVEATISLRIAAGSSWPRGIQGVFTASIASIDDAEVSLLSFEDDKLPVFADDGTIKLTRRVVSVECEHGELKVSATTWCANDEPYAMTNDIVFTPRFAGRSCGVLNIGTCKIQITVAWSLFDW
ncbi:hypothetical protein CFC21_039841 [Triticum aestivum]|uniref:DUF6598 domain-containing protein n=2 Tax=Triticum aestivum TaxID=4565 RepID=A0A3B6UA27_WHEAT|nr:hypothetical protein CFC21_039841 [Triticum aestivum]